MGHTSTVSYVAEAARVVFQETGLLPHINAGTLQHSQLTDLRQWSASQVRSRIWQL
jgi:FO synthase